MNETKTKADLTRFLPQVELKPDLAALLHYLGDSHVMRLLPDSQLALVTVSLPALSDLVSVRLTVTLVYQCPEIVQGIVPHDKHIFQCEL